MQEKGRLQDKKGLNFNNLVKLDPSQVNDKRNLMKKAARRALKEGTVFEDGGVYHRKRK